MKNPVSLKYSYDSYYKYYPSSIKLRLLTSADSGTYYQIYSILYSLNHPHVRNDDAEIYTILII